MKLEIAASAGNFGGVSPTIGRLRQLLTYHGKFLCKFGTDGVCHAADITNHYRANEPECKTIGLFCPVFLMPGSDTHGRVAVSLRTRGHIIIIIM